MPIVDGVNVPNNPQNGAWYQGRQYWDGTLSAPGVINSKSNQVGAGQAVSDEVNRQSSIAQGKAPDAIKTYLSGGAGTGNGISMPSNTYKGANAVISGQGSGIPGGIQAPPTIDLKSIYDNLYKTSGISEKEAELTKAEKDFLEARNKFSNNPYLSASDMDNRITRIRQKYEQDTAPLRNEIAVKKADIETKLALETKQFDINSQSAQQAISQFNSLLGMGALDNANGEDIASITRATGMSSGMIQSAIQASRDKSLQTSTQSFDDGSEEGFVVYTIDPRGNIVNQVRQVTGKSSKAKATTSYSADPAVSSFLSALLGGNAPSASSSSDISSLWP